MAWLGKTAFSYMAIFSAFSALPVRWKGPPATVLRVLGTVFIDVSFLNTTCSLGTSILDQYVLFALMPVVLGLVGGLLNLLTNISTWPKFINTYFGVLQMLFVPILMHATSPMRFIQHEGADGVKTMLAHPNIRDGSNAHSKFVGWAGWSLIYMSAFLAASSWACRLMSIALARNDNVSTLQVTFKFLHERFRPRHAIWGIVYLVRNAAVILIASLLQNIPVQQVYLALAVVLIVAVTAARVRPFRTELLNVLDASFGILVSLFLATGMTLAGYPGEDDVDDALYPISLSVMVSLMVATVVVAGCIFVLAIDGMCKLGIAAKFLPEDSAKSSGSTSHVGDGRGLDGVEDAPDPEERVALLSQQASNAPPQYSADS